MNIINIAYDFSAIVEALMFFMMFSAFFEKRKPFVLWQYAVGVAVLTVMIGIVNTYSLHRASNSVGMILSAICVSIIFYHASWKMRVSAPIFVWLMMMTAEIIVLQVESIVFHVTVQEIISNPAYLVLGIIVSKSLALAICYAIRVKRRTSWFEFDLSYWLLFVALFTSAILSTFMIYWMLGVLDDPAYSAMALISSVGSYISVFLALYLYEHSREQSRIIRQQEQSERQMSTQIKHMDEVILKQNELRAIRHDMKSHFIALYDFFRTDNNQAGQRYIETISDQFTHATATIYTGNNTLDAIISAKKSLAESKSIVFDTTLHIGRNLPIAPNDLSIIYGNALDNAIEACDRLSELAEKHISLTLRQNAEFIFCTITNTAPPRRSSTFATSKADAINHGFGLGNIKEALEKYDAELHISLNCNNKWDSGCL